LIAFTFAFVHEVREIVLQPLSAWTEDVNADCAIALTGGPNRVREGFDLLSKRNVLKLIVSGVNPQAELRNILPVWPYYGDLHEQDVILDRRSRTTYGNAQQSLPLVEALHCRDAVLITSRVHMYRALKTFRAQFPVGYAIVPYAVAGTIEPPSWDEISVEALKSLFYSLWAY
jgi:uncharacterized SAM-binding protein YcdF (DUF218 family)